MRLVWHASKRPDAPLSGCSGRAVVRIQIPTVSAARPAGESGSGGSIYAAAHSRLRDVIPVHRAKPERGKTPYMRMAFGGGEPVHRRAAAISPRLPVHIVSDRRDHEPGSILSSLAPAGPRLGAA